MRIALLTFALLAGLGVAAGNVAPSLGAALNPPLTGLFGSAK